MSMNVLCKMWSNLKLDFVTHPTKLGPTQPWLLASLWTFPMPPFWKAATAQGTRNFSVKWLIKSAQWFAWQSACRIVFGRHGNQIRFLDLRDWAAPNTVFQSLSLEQLVGQWSDGISLVSGAGRGGQVGKRRENQCKTQGAKASLWPADCVCDFLDSGALISEKWLILEEWAATHPY